MNASEVQEYADRLISLLSAKERSLLDKHRDAPADVRKAYVAALMGAFVGNHNGRISQDTEGRLYVRGVRGKQKIVDAISECARIRYESV